MVMVVDEARVKFFSFVFFLFFLRNERLLG